MFCRGRVEMKRPDIKKMMANYSAYPLGADYVSGIIFGISDGESDDMGTDIEALMQSDDGETSEDDDAEPLEPTATGTQGNSTRQATLPMRTMERAR